MADFNDEHERLSDDEIKAEFARLFPQGWAGVDVLGELAPQGWAESPFVAVYHPSAAQVYEESVRIHRNIADLRRKPDALPAAPEPTLEEVTASHTPSPVEAERECQELVGLCLWDIFSDNHEVIAADGRKLDLGSMRSSGGFLAEVLNAQGGPSPAARPELPAELMAKMFPPVDNLDPATAALVEQMRKEMIGDGGYTYLDFYMGTGAISSRADLRPVYEMIFRRLRSRGMDWEYHFPRLQLVDMRPLKKQLDDQQRGDDPEWAEYDPTSALEEERREQKREEEIAEMRHSLDEGYRESLAEAQDKAPPATVQAYQHVYGQSPKGWPPVAESM
jgi:hypothetical protein